MENIGDEQVEVPTSGIGMNTKLNFELVDGQNRRYEVKHQTASGLEIGPGLTETALFAFEVPASQETRYLVVESERVEIVETE
jgi:hypothetical protein